MVGVVFALNGYKKSYDFTEIKNKDSWRQKVPNIDVEKKFQLISPKVNRRDVIFLLGPSFINQTTKKTHYLEFHLL